MWLAGLGDTLRRIEAEGVIRTVKRITYARGKESRVYKAAEVKRTASTKPRERWSAKLPGWWA